MPCDVQSPNEPWIEFPCLISVSTVASFSTPNSPLSSSTGSSLCPVSAGTPANRTPQVEMSCATPRQWTQGRYVAPGPPLSHHSCLVWLWKVRRQRLQPVSKSGEENTGEGEGWRERVPWQGNLQNRHDGRLGLLLRLAEWLPGIHRAMGWTPSRASLSLCLNSKTWEVGAGGTVQNLKIICRYTGDGGQPGIHDFLSQTKKTNTFLMLSKSLTDV